MKPRALLIIVVLAVGLPWPVVAAVTAEWLDFSVTREELVCPVRKDWSAEHWERWEKEETENGIEWSVECPCESLWKPTNKQLQNLLIAHANSWQDIGRENLSKFRLGNLCNADLQNASLQGVNLIKVNLQGAFLFGAKLQKALLWGTNLQNTHLGDADLQEADLHAAHLEEAYLWSANLQMADLKGTTLRKADLRRADLSGADLTNADIEGARLAFTNLTGATYAPVSPPSPFVEGMTGLGSVVLPYDQKTRTTLTSGMAQLRKFLQEAGLRDQEREATFTIEHHKAAHSRCQITAAYGGLEVEQVIDRCRKERGLFTQVGGWLQLVFFEWTTDWGLHPERALLIMLGLMAGMTFVYAIPISIIPRFAAKKCAIIRVYPTERALEMDEGYASAEKPHMERLYVHGPAVFAWAFYFSMLSSFHIGWRDFNVGTWISRIQPTEFALRGRGWVRVASGLQSLFSVYLLAMWALTYFGRPFQ